MTSPSASVPADASVSTLPVLRLRHGEERRLLAGHLWIFSNEIDTSATPLVRFGKGALCRVLSSRDRFMGFAYVNPNSLIAARILSRDPGVPPGREWLAARLRSALALRERLYPKPYYRLVFGESDGLPGLVLDRFGDFLVGQIGTAGMEALREEIVAAIREVVAPRAMLWKNDGGARELEGLPAVVETAFGDVPEHVDVEENGVRFRVPVLSGQKTGWFFDQAANRQALLKYVPGRRVLDVFSYLGAWGLSAARHGASAVTCVDASAPALSLLNEAAAANGLACETIQSDAFAALERLHEQGRQFDVVIIDPPAFIKRRKDIPKGEAAYRRLNQLAMQLLPRDGVLVSCSCSYHLEPAQLVGAINRAGRHLRRFVQILETGGQGPDHPVHPAIAETRYLKAFFCRVADE